jgi:hypothetical protein
MILEVRDENHGLAVGAVGAGRLLYRARWSG